MSESKTAPVFVEVTKDELQCISLATTFLRTALDVQPVDTLGRDLVLKAQQTILTVLGSVNKRDTSWH